MPFVIDASVAVKFLTVEAGSAGALAYVDSPESLIAPELILPEVANALWKKVKNSELLEVHAEAGLEDLPQFFVELAPIAELMRVAVRLSYSLRHAVYDCLYLALALREQATLVTADAQFMKAVESASLQRHVELLPCT